MRYHWVRLYALFLAVVLFGAAMLMGIKNAHIIFRESIRQKHIARSEEKINFAEETIENGISEIAKAAGREQYDRLLELVKVEDDSRLSEMELEGYFRTGYINRIKDAFGGGDDGDRICATLASFIDGERFEELKLIKNGKTKMVMETDAEGVVNAIRVGSVMIVHDDPNIGRRTDEVSFVIHFPDAVFHAGNDELFRYCLVAGKGIYFTGPTSSVIGDLFAGVHTAKECRDAESIYGETGTYGGINILSTQLGIRADRIVSEGDININASFVMFTPLADGLNCYGQRLNEIEGFTKKTNYTMDGTFIPMYGVGLKDAKEYYDAVNLIDTSLEGLKDISMYYDTNNDGGYTGRFRKLLSDSDIELTSDFTGIVATPANVIINKDVNFEGVMLCGDRIYARGNNNIVANAGVARSIIALESESNYGVRVGDFIGGMKTAGLKDPDGYVTLIREQ